MLRLLERELKVRLKRKTPRWVSRFKRSTWQYRYCYYLGMHGNLLANVINGSNWNATRVEHGAANTLDAASHISGSRTWMSTAKAFISKFRASLMSSPNGTRRSCSEEVLLSIISYNILNLQTSSTSMPNARSLVYGHEVSSSTINNSTNAKNILTNFPVGINHIPRLPDWPCTIEKRGEKWKTDLPGASLFKIVLTEGLFGPASSYHPCHASKFPMCLS